MAVRIQRRRVRGWRMPAGAVYVGRPTVWGNPFTIENAIESGFAHDEESARRLGVVAFRDWLCGTGGDWWRGPESDRRRAEILAALGELRGRDLVCWCPLDRPCHADVLLELANGPGVVEGCENRSGGALKGAPRTKSRRGPGPPGRPGR